MPTESVPGADPQAQRLQQMGASIEQLNARIARLAIALDVSLQTEDDMARVMSRPAPVPTERRASTERRAPSRLSSSPDRRIAHQREELRGLLVLRYSVEMRYVSEVGAVATRHLLVQAEAHLARDGFKPGADGMNLDRLFRDD